MQQPYRNDSILMILFPYKMATSCSQMKNVYILILLSLSFVFGNYVVGDQISIDDQNMEFGYCYPADSSESIFSFSKHTGKVFMIEMSATW